MRSDAEAYLMNNTKLKMLFQEGIGFFKGIFMEFMDTLQKHLGMTVI